MIVEWIRHAGSWFSVEQYLFWSRVEGTLWTAADFFIVFYLLQIVNLLRQQLGRRRHIFPYVALALTLPFAALIPVAPTGRAFWRLELVVTIPHFLLAIYLLIANRGFVALGLRLLCSAKDSDDG